MEHCLDAELFLDDYPSWDARGPHCPFILQWMFIHAAKSRWKEAERLIYHGCWQGLPKLDPEVDISTIQLVGYQMSSEEIGDLYHQEYMLKRLPRLPPCGPERAQQITKDIVSSLKDCLRQKEMEQPGGGREPESASTHPPHPCDWASQRGRQDTSGE